MSRKEFDATITVRRAATGKFVLARSAVTWEFVIARSPATRLVIARAAGPWRSMDCRASLAMTDKFLLAMTDKFSLAMTGKLALAITPLRHGKCGIAYAKPSVAAKGGAR